MGRRAVRAVLGLRALELDRALPFDAQSQNVEYVATLTPITATISAIAKDATYERCARTIRRSDSKRRPARCAMHPITAKPSAPTARCSFRSNHQPMLGAWMKIACFRRARYSG